MRKGTYVLDKKHKKKETWEAVIFNCYLATLLVHSFIQMSENFSAPELRRLILLAKSGMEDSALILKGGEEGSSRTVSHGQCTATP